MELFGFLSSSMKGGWAVRIPLRIQLTFPLPWESLTLGEADEKYG